jgi:hypothetical protein
MKKHLEVGLLFLLIFAVSIAVGLPVAYFTYWIITVDRRYLLPLGIVMGVFVIAYLAGGLDYLLQRRDRIITN